MIGLPLLIVLPLLGAVSIQAARTRERVLTTLWLGFSGALLVDSCAVLASVWAEGVLVYRIGGWPRGLGLGMAADSAGGLLLLLVCAIGFASLWYAEGEMKRSRNRAGFLSAFMFLIAGLNGVVLSTDLFNMFVFVELASVSAYILVGSEGRPDQIEASVKYAFLGTLSSLVFLAGIALVYDQVGALGLWSISRFAEAGGAKPLGIPMLMVLVGIGLPGALFPMFFWLPDAHSQAPSSVSAALSAAYVQVALFAVFRVFGQCLGLGGFGDMLLWAGAAAAVLGSMAALVQTDMKRLLAYSTVASCGISFMLIGISSASSFTAFLFHILNHALAKAAMFLSAGLLIHQTSQRRIDQMGGAWTVGREACLMFLLGALADVGGPSVGFFDKAYSFISLAGRDPCLLLILIVGVATLAAAYARTFQFFLGPSPPGHGRPTETPRSMMAATAVVSLPIAASAPLAWLLLDSLRVSAVHMASRAAIWAMEVI